MEVVLDTRLLIAYTFSPTRLDRDRVAKFVSRLFEGRVLIPSIVVAEYIKVAGRRIGRVAAENMLRGFMNYGAEGVPVTPQDGYLAGRILLENPDTPLADALIAALARRRGAAIATDDRSPLPFHSA